MAEIADQKGDFLLKVSMISVATDIGQHQLHRGQADGDGEDEPQNKNLKLWMVRCKNLER